MADLTAIEQIQARIEAKRKAHADTRADAAVADWEAYEQALERYGYDAVKRLKLPRLVEGLPTFVLVRAADADVLRFYRRDVMKAKRGRDHLPDLAVVDRALATLGAASIVYPDAATLAKVKDMFPSVEKDAGIVAKEMSEAEAEEEGN